MFRMRPANRERTVESLAHIAGGERELERALQAFRTTYGDDPSGQEFLAFLYDRRVEAEAKERSSKS